MNTSQVRLASKHTDKGEDDFSTLGLLLQWEEGNISKSDF